MFPWVFPLAAFCGVWLLTQRSLGWGLAGVLAVGYFNGYIRANYLSVYTTFMFDLAVLGLYVGAGLGHPQEVLAALRSPAGQWVAALIAWPALMCVLPINDLLVQLVAFRATVWFLPVLLIAARLRPADLAVLARVLAVLNLIALGGGLYIYRYGVEAVYPENAVTNIIYRSRDVGGDGYHRVPSFFLNAHAYGGTMLLSLPLLLDRLLGRGVRGGDRLLAGCGTAAALVGILLCAARQPVVQLALLGVCAWGIARFHVWIGLGMGLVAAATVTIAQTDARLQRAWTLLETEQVSERVRASANESFVELLLSYPAGAGMGSSVGTSIPYFLADRAPRGIGLENEYSRILVDQGWVGLGLWLGFLVWLLHRPPPVWLRVEWGVGVVVMYAAVLVNWSTAFIGTGTLSSIPASVLLLVQMGVLVRVRQAVAAWGQ